VNAMPKQLDSPLVAVWCEHAGAPELEELQVAVSRDQFPDAEFAGGIESAILFGQRLPQQTIGSDNRRPIKRIAVARGMVDYQQMVADCVVAIDVAPRKQPARIGDGRTFLIENAITKFLRLPYLGSGLGQSHLERADAAEALRGPVCARSPCL